MSNEANVTAAKPKVEGAVFVGTSTATLPTDATSTLTGFTSLGYISEDGLTNSNSPSTEFIKAWGGDKVLPITEAREDTFSFTLIEAMSAEVLKVVYGDDNVTETEGVIKVISNSTQLESKVFVIDMILRGGKLKRIVIPAGYVTEIGDITYSDSDAAGYEITIQAQEDASGNTHYEYIA